MTDDQQQLSLEDQNQPLIPGDTVGSFEIVKQLGSGGMGEVYLAKQVAMNREVALKVLNPEFTVNKQAVDRFFREVEVAAKLEHPNIVTAFDAGKQGPYHYLAMSYVDGYDLSSRLEKGKMSEVEVLHVALSITKALNYAWKKFGMLHRDIKPANIMVNSANEVKLMDMGIAKTHGGTEEATDLTAFGMILGTPYYMSPEQSMNNQELDCRCDIYSLGATLYHLITGVKPYDGESSISVITKHLSEPLTPPKDRILGISDKMNDIMCKMMEKDREDRFRNWDELEHDLNELTQDFSTLTSSMGFQGVDTEGVTQIIEKPVIDQANQVHSPQMNITGVIPEEKVSQIATKEPPENFVQQKKSSNSLYIVVAIILLVTAAFILIPKDEIDNHEPIQGLEEQEGEREIVEPKLVESEETDTIMAEVVSESIEISTEQKVDKLVAPIEIEEEVVFNKAYEEYIKITGWENLKKAYSEMLPIMHAYSEILKDSDLTKKEESFQLKTKKVESLLLDGANQESLTYEADFKELLKLPINHDSIKKTNQFITKYDAFLADAKIIQPFALTSLKTIEIKKEHLETRFKNKLKHFETQEKILALLMQKQKETDLLEISWKEKAKLDAKAIAKIQQRTSNIDGIEIDSEADKMLTKLQEQLTDLAKVNQEAQVLRKQVASHSEVQLPVKFGDLAAKERASNALSKLINKVEVNKLGSEVFTKEQVAVLTDIEQKITQIPVAEPWEKYYDETLILVEQAKSSKTENSTLAELMNRAAQVYHVSLNKGLSKKKPNHNFSMFLEKSPEHVQHKLVAQMINPGIKVISFTYTKSPSSQMQKVYPQHIVVAIDPDGKSNQRIKLDLTLVLSGSTKNYEITKPFYIAVHETGVRSFREYSKTVLQKVMFDDAVVCVNNQSYTTIAEYCNWLSKNTGLQPAFEIPKNKSLKSLRFIDSNGFSLPTIAQWYVAFDQSQDKGYVQELTVQSKMPTTENAIAISALYGNLSELTRNLKGNLVKKETVLGISYLQENVAENFERELYSDDPRKDVGFRVMMPIINIF
ncbi:MAG: serine/threonine protein kinase [Lentisphaeria bacterium]|nr:serine/threonine protein kinase [Lentisphaeria bacterium]